MCSYFTKALKMVLPISGLLHMYSKSLNKVPRKFWGATTLTKGSFLS